MAKRADVIGSYHPTVVGRYTNQTEVGRTLDIDRSGAILLPDVNAYADRLGGV
jgi:hypothetical protein